MDNKYNLKSCPFCGNEYCMLYSPNNGYSWVASCEHGDCMIRTLPCEYKEDAIKRWNKRTDKPYAT